MDITYYGHSCYLIQVNNIRILFDPFISGNPLASGIKIEDINPDYILISHGHNDHTGDVLEIAEKSQALIICSWEISEWLQSKGLKNIRPVNHGGHLEFDFGKLKVVNAVHSSSMPDGTYGGNALGFIVHTSEYTFYYAGDTALTLDMKLIPHWYQLDFAFLPIGNNFTMDIDDAVLASEFIHCKNIIGMHYDTFGWIQIDHTVAKQKFKAAEKELILMSIGETLKWNQ